MKASDLKTTSLECDRKCWVYSNGNSITFSEIEMDLQKRLKRIKVRVYGDYFPEDLSIEPIVYIQADYEGYHYRERIEKRLFIDYDNIDSFYDWLAEKIAHCFGIKLFLERVDKQC